MISKYPQSSDWSTDPVNTDFKYDYRRDPEKEGKKRCRCPCAYWTCCSCLSPLLQGLIVGILTGCLVLAVIISLWLTSASKTSTTTSTQTGSLSVSTTNNTVATTITTTFTTTITTTTAKNNSYVEVHMNRLTLRVHISTANWLINGDGETGPCESGTGVTHPTGWMYNGTITQIYYNNNISDISPTDPGPSDRGNCLFYGQLGIPTSSMWQTVNMTNSINPLLIDNQTVLFNFSAWLGGYQEQDDNAQTSLIFMDHNNNKVGSTTTLGPVLAADRGNISSLVFRQANGYIPIGARSFLVVVTLTRLIGTYDDGDIDNIAVILHQ